MNIRNFKTKTEFIERANGAINGVWEIGLDIGYSAVKLFSPNMIARFPSYARRVDDDFKMLTGASPETILYKDSETGEMWVVGEMAQNLIQSNDTSDSEASLYGRERYGNPMFKVVTRTGLGIGMLKNQYGTPEGKKLIIQTGLPEKYIKMDTDSLVSVLAGTHKFQLKIGQAPWVEFEFTLNGLNDDIYVMSQPMGTLFSAAISKNGQWHPDASKYLKSNVLVFDPGFGTLDLFPIVSSVVQKGETYADLGMKRVLHETCNAIFDEYHTEYTVPAMQKALGTGVVRVAKKVDGRTVTKDEPFGHLLEASNKKVCKEALIRTESVINLVDFDYLIVTGGTGAAWLEYIKEAYKDMETLKIIYGNQNDNLPFVYSNVRGYFIYRYNKLVKEYGKA